MPAPEKPVIASARKERPRLRTQALGYPCDVLVDGEDAVAAIHLLIVTASKFHGGKRLARRTMDTDPSDAKMEP
jgi:hypothetical protein